jgi:hypothetical protein
VPNFFALTHLSVQGCLVLPDGFANAGMHEPAFSFKIFIRCKMLPTNCISCWKRERQVIESVDALAGVCLTQET